MAETRPPCLNVLTVDLEEWFVVEALAERIPQSEWHEHKSTLIPNVRRLLHMFARRNVRATWFVLGWCAELQPALMREIVDYGHEIACHSYKHTRVDTMTAQQFREDTKRATGAIAEASGLRPIGFRAPSWSINQSTPWAFEILAELGYIYDSSIFPIKHDIYGIPEGPREAFKMTLPNNRTLWEIPASTVRFMGQNLPVGGGGYLRHSPYWYSRSMVKRLNSIGRPAIVYMHPWELDPDPPIVPGLSATQRFRMYGSTDTFALKLDRLLSEFEFATMSAYLGSISRRPIGFEQAV